MRYLVLGAGLQGRAAAYDLLKSEPAAEVTLADRETSALEALRAWLAGVLPGAAGAGRVRCVACDAAEPGAVAGLARGHDVVLSCVPYWLNLELARAALAAGCHFLDLGGSTALVLKELELDGEARRAGRALVPDCGLGPGLISTLAVHAMRGLESVDEVRLYDGGLPQRRDLSPLGYRLVFSVEGLINEYLAPATALRDGQRVEVPALSELEVLDLPEPLGRCEAAHAAGGLSTMAWTYEGRVGTMFNKLLRYPGHIAVMRGLAELGFFDSAPARLADGREVAPRALAARLLERAFDHPREPDLVFIRVVVRGSCNGQPLERVGELLDRADPQTGVTAMMRTTGFPAAIVARLMADGTIPAGARPVERAVPSEPFLRQAAERGLRVRWHETVLG